jgi:hypothetical protein
LSDRTIYCGSGIRLHSQWSKRRSLADAAYYNLLVAAVRLSCFVATGVLVWQFQLEGQELKGMLLLHLILAGVSTVMS